MDKIKIKYPLAFKKEVAGCTKYMSKKMTSKVFNIDRKRICEWVNDLSSGKKLIIWLQDKYLIFITIDNLLC